MCGITGLVAWWQGQARNRQVIIAMTETQHHRGPDDAGVWVDDHVAFGHTRLSIIDRSGGAQPMVVRRPGSGEVAITFSGEVYNHFQLREQLTAAGHRFAGRSDTEVVLRAYLHWGEGFVHHLRGIYAFGLWDCDLELLLLVRDRLGVKPLYVARTPTDLVFGSELKALLAHPDLTAEVDEEGLGELLGLVPMTSPGHAVLRGIEEVPPATVLRHDRDGLTRHRYWQLESHPHLDDRDTTVRRVRDLLERAVIEQAAADVPVGALLSGGLDSSAVVALAAGTTTQPLLTFDIDHGSTAAHTASSFHRSHDHPYALAVARHTASEHRTVQVGTGDLLRAHESTLASMDLPSLTTINASLSHLFARISPHRRVVLSGEGADELFAGYRWHDAAAAPRGTFPWSATYQPLVAVLRRETLRQVRPVRYARQRCLAALEQMPALDGETGLSRRLREIRWLTIVFYLAFLLRRADRLAMAHGVEVRVPFLDHRLVQYTWNIGGGWQRARGLEKGLLREAVDGLLPEQVTWRPKSGYPASLTSTYQDALWEKARELVTDPNAPVLGLVSARRLKALLDVNHGHLDDWTATQHVAYILELDAWLRRYSVRIR
ncbi:asparagine synthase (glutamine-hydrolyzing) [Catellatospora sp. KI3]|uniref:asparagine synthase (glutamine-hydrolyzing) n=1 Tax=Catellatospora sp. KI3 TaxID=3041620 RepID=UPI002482958A|nr:asparagine synthase (glutamine-hydrolyzing) [Catellatospora sp. KI3]MDI1462220.1 asparagine synthase (glutamine-hydrolyzing) [Catellatospora sp. KI3]